MGHMKGAKFADFKSQRLNLVQVVQMGCNMIRQYRNANVGSDCGISLKLDRKVFWCRPRTCKLNVDAAIFTDDSVKRVGAGL